MLEAVLFGLRRRAMNVSALAIETDLRRDFYQHLQRLPVSFHDRWPSGQLLSRVTSDLSTLRRFVGFMAVFFVANLAVIVVVLVLLVRLQPVLGLAVCVVMLPLAFVTRHYERRYNLQARRAQDLTGDLATGVEESVLGIRVVKSFGRRGAAAAHLQRRRRPAARGRADQEPDAGQPVDGHRHLPAAGAGRGDLLRAWSRSRTAR